MAENDRTGSVAWQIEVGAPGIPRNSGPSRDIDLHGSDDLPLLSEMVSVPVTG